MATILELAQMSSNVYDGTSSRIQNSLPIGDLLKNLPNWTVFDNSNSQHNFWADGYFGVAYRNTVTGEIVIANRGTDLDHGPTTAFQNLATDLSLGKHGGTQVQQDAVVFAKQVLSTLIDAGTPFTNFIETGHSLGGNEAQAAVAALVDDHNPTLPSSLVSAVVFNSPGIGGYRFSSTYNVIDLYNQGDAIHLSGGVHLGGAGKLGMLAAGPDTSSLALLAPLAIVAGPAGILGLLSAALYDVVHGAHKIATIIAYISTGGAGNATGTFNWTSGSNAALVPTSTANPLLPAYSVDSKSNLALTDPISGVTALFDLSSISRQTISATFSGGSTAAARALSSLGVVSVPLAQLGQNLSSVTGASLLSEFISRNNDNSLDITFQNGVGGHPSDGNHFLVTAANSSNPFSYAIPGPTQTIVETIDNGVNNGTGSIVVLGATATTLTGGGASPGQVDVWTDTVTGVQYNFTPASANASLGTLTISKGLLGNSGNEIIVDNFNLSAAHGSAGFLGIVLPGALSLNAAATAGMSTATPYFIAGVEQSYTLSTDSPNATAQSIIVTLSEVPISSFNAFVGTTPLPINADGTFSVTLPAGETNVAFSLSNVSTVANGAPLLLTASMASLAGPSALAIGSAPLAQIFLMSSGDNPFAAPGVSTLYGKASGLGWNFSDAPQLGYTAGTPGAGYNFINSGGINEKINGGSGNDTIYANFGGGLGSTLDGGTDIINGNGGQDAIYANAYSGDIRVYAGTETSLANAIQVGNSGGASGLLGDLFNVVDPYGASGAATTLVGGSGNDLFATGSSNALVVMGPGNDAVYGGMFLTEASYPPGVFPSPFSTSGWGTFDASGVTVNGGQSLSSSGPLLAPPTGYEGNTVLGYVAGVGNDTIYAGSGSSSIALSNGNNFVQLGSGTSNVSGGMGSDTVFGGSGASLIFGGGGNDYLATGSGNATVEGDGGNNTIIGGSGVDYLYAGSSGANYATFETGSNIVFGGSGSGQILGSGGSDTLISGAGTYTIIGGAGLESIVGGSGNDLLQGGTGNDTIQAAGGGNDTLLAVGSATSTSVLYGGTGSDTIFGGSGSNVLYAGDGGTVAKPTQVAANQTDATSTTTIYGGLGIDQLFGGPGSSVIYAGDGGTAAALTTIQAGSGSTTIHGGLGTDSIIGGTGAEVIYAGDGGSSSASTRVFAGTGVATIYGGAGNDLLQDTASGVDLIAGGTGNASIVGIGNDTLVAGAGNSLIQSNGGVITAEMDAGFGNVSVSGSGGGKYNLYFGSTIASADFLVAPVIDSAGGLDLQFSGDGGGVVAYGALTGTLGSIVFADPQTFTIAQLILAHGGDQTYPSDNPRLAP